ncbi:MAG: hypothetical protein QNJ60_14590 [Xenococcaceae cyanobacterium MO_188.B19]|nr:hypothetical protein [Xenococcaceae cyanobacterium MO_188.B19]
MSNQTQTDWAVGVLNKLTSNGERIAVLEFKLDEFKQQAKERFDLLDEGLDKINKRLDKIDKKLEESDGVVQNINNKLEQNDGQLNQTETRLDDIEKVIKQIQIALKLLKWIAGGVGAILLSIVANFLYSWFS